MIYTKTKLKDGAVVHSPVTAKSTYTSCAVCGREIQMDLRELILAKAEDPYNTEVNCTNCSEKMMHTSNINFNAVTRLTSALKEMGYGAELQKIYDKVGIDDVREITPDECKLFLNDLLNKVLEVRYDG